MYTDTLHVAVNVTKKDIQ